MSVGPSIKLTPDLSAAVLAEMRKAWEAGRPWSKAPQSKDRFAVKRLVADHGFTAAKAEEVIGTWEASGLIRHETWSAKARVSGFKVVGELGQLVHNDGIFA
jgi:hypothetical protein